MIEVTAKEQGQEKRYPYIGESTINGDIVIFAAEGSGFALNYEGSEGMHYDEDWDESRFTPYVGSITLENK